MDFVNNMLDQFKGKFEPFPTGSVHIQLEKNYYYAGSNITGHIYLNLQTPCPGNVLFLKLKGWESTQWITEHNRGMLNEQNQHLYPHAERYEGSDFEISDTSSDSDEFKEKKEKRTIIRGNTIYDIVKHVGGRKLMSERIPLNTFPGDQIPPGQYCFPFAFATNKEWPGSYFYFEKKAKGLVKYQLKVECGNNSRRIKHTVDIRLHERPEDIRQEVKSINATHKACCCIGKGQTNLKCFFDKNAYYIGENANIICECDNSQSQAAINSINANIIHRQTFYSNDGASFTQSKTIKTESFGGMAPGEVAQGQSARHKNMSVDSNQKKSKRNRTMLEPSTTGKTVKSEYILQVHCNMDVCCGCCGDTPQVNNVVLIYPEMIEQPQFVFPQNWQPQEFPVNNVVVGGVPFNPDNPYNKEPDIMLPPQ